MQTRHYIKYLILTAIAPILWGTTYLVTTEFLPPDRPIFAALMRVLPVGLLLILLKWKLPQGQEWRHVSILSFLNIACFQTLLFFAAYRLEGGIAAVIGSIQPLVILLLTWLIDSKPLNKLALSAILSSILGMCLLLIQPDLKMKLDVWGYAAAFFGAVSMALGIYLTKKWKPKVDNLTFTGWQLFFGGLMLCPVFVLFETLPDSITLVNILGYSYLALFGSLLAYSLFFAGIAKLPTVAVSILGVFSPITALCLGWIILGQTLTHLQVLGFLIVLISVIVVQIQSRV